MPGQESTRTGEAASTNNLGMRQAGYFPPSVYEASQSGRDGKVARQLPAKMLLNDAEPLRAGQPRSLFQRKKSTEESGYLHSGAWLL